MKPVINNNQKEVVVFVENLEEENVDTDKIYAFYNFSNGHAEVITQIDGEYKTVWVYPDEMRHAAYEGDLLRQIIQEILDDGYEVFEFDGEAEFGQWLINCYNKTFEECKNKK